jgi:mono/diheme cytochrome c family protein
MNRFICIATVVSALILLAGCDGPRRDPGRAYIPDMAYGRAYKTYIQLDSTRFTMNDNERGEGKIFYNGRPVPGTMALGDGMPFPYAIDKPGDTANYVASKQGKNPFPVLDAVQMKEAERLYLVNCGICHGSALDGNGPLYKNGDGPFTSAPRNLITYVLPEGQMFYSMTYGKNAMGSYASQLSTKQRWMIIDYVKSKQTKTGDGGSSASQASGNTGSSAAPAKDSTKKKI